jgi:hypothetical protein|tara:strand:+ start:613 stop:1011 length:399 start_codon:yes stop_codon:yes gene_type:complete
MDWDKKTDEQYNTYMTVMAGGDNENEAHLTEEEWVMVTGAMGDLIDLLTGESNLEYLKKEYEGIVPELKSLLIKMLDVENFDNSPIFVSEIDYHRLKTGKESVSEYLKRQKSAKDLEKLTKELQAWKIHHNN